MRILIIDDSDSLRGVLGALFAELGHEVVASLPNGDGAEEIISYERPHLVCLDYNMPGRNGLEILRSINSMAPEVDVVFMTASTDAKLELQAADAGASGFLRKPFNKPQIIAELKEVAEARALVSKNDAQSSATPSSQPSTGAASPSAAGGARRRTVVLADDSGSVRMVLKGVLEEIGLKVVQAVGNGAEAIQAAKAHKPGVLCLDVNMPVMSGLEALPKIRELSPQTAVVMVTGAADKEFVKQAAALGAVGYLVKPVRPAHVQDFMQKLLKRS